MTLIDISPALSPSIAVFPGDSPLTREVLLDLRNDDNLTLSTLRSTVHIGSHLDAPSHYDAEGDTIDAIDLQRCIGPCDVMRIDVERGSVIEELPRDPCEERLILATGTHPDPQQWGGDFAGIDPGLIEKLSAAGVRLLGVDTPSVDVASSKDLPAHDACRRTGILILEGLVLDGVSDGIYELIALPLKLTGFDASPVRAVLRSLDR
ncbi:MAG: cyclase family protein [Planctomycetota bacterium]|nr:cyclase family protein [Planctomycetota bacterium]